MGTYTLERIPHDKQVAVFALHSAGYSQTKICKLVGISHPTVSRIIHQVPVNVDEVESYKKALMARQYAISMRATNYITDEKLDKMNALQLMTINAIGIDKARDMEGSNRPVFNIIQAANDLGKGLQELKDKQAVLAAARTHTSTEAI